MKDAEFIQRAIPDELRDINKHPDTKLVAQAITVALLEARAASRDEWTDASAAKRVNAKLQAFYTEVFVPHLTEEDEQWKKLQDIASSVSVARITEAHRLNNVMAEFEMLIGEKPVHGLLTKRDTSERSWIEVRIAGDDFPLAIGEGNSGREAIVSVLPPGTVLVGSLPVGY